jgi:hypothetical protein
MLIKLFIMEEIFFQQLIQYLRLEYLGLMMYILGFGMRGDEDWEFIGRNCALSAK